MTVAYLRLGLSSIAIALSVIAGPFLVMAVWP